MSDFAAREQDTRLPYRRCLREASADRYDVRIMDEAFPPSLGPVLWGPLPSEALLVAWGMQKHSASALFFAMVSKSSMAAMTPAERHEGEREGETGNLGTSRARLGDHDDPATSDFVSPSTTAAGPCLRPRFVACSAALQCDADAGGAVAIDGPARAVRQGFVGQSV